MLTTSQKCNACGAAAEVSFGERVVGSHLSWSASISCRGCGARTELDGKDYLPEDLRSLVLKSTGGWTVYVTPIDRTRTLLVLRQLLELSMPEMARIAATLPGPVRSGSTQAEAISFAHAIPKDVATVQVRKEAGDAEADSPTGVGPSVSRLPGSQSIAPMRTERTIRNCTVRMKVVCPITWDGLQSTDRPDVRHCAQCGTDVFFCATDAETLERVRVGHCIARERPHASELPPVIMGRGELVPSYTDKQQLALRLHRREEGLNTLIKRGLHGKDRDCPECGYPVPSFRKTCYVCGFTLGRALE